MVNGAIKSENDKKEIKSISSENLKRRKHKHPRPFLLTLLCLFSFVFYGLISIFLLLAFFFSGWISEVRNSYLPDRTESKGTIIFIIVTGLLLHLVALYGSINIWHRRKSGYLMLSISTLIIALYQLFSDKISVFTTAVYILLIVLFGIYYRRFH
jgi:hypothetical protein